MSILSKMDSRLLALLQSDALQSADKLASQLKVHPATVRRRTKALIKDGILHIVASVDHRALGHTIVVIIGLEVAPRHVKSTLEILKAEPDIRWLSSTTGRFNIVARARFISSKEMASFTENVLNQIEGLSSYEIFTRLNTHKYNFNR
jgi:DNA-binding Lrp family transcriptional regulator